MPQPTAPAPADATAAHGHLDCADTEALLAEAAAENTRLHTLIDDLTRRLNLALAQKNLAIDEAVALRAHTP